MLEGLVQVETKEGWRNLHAIGVSKALDALPMFSREWGGVTARMVDNDGKVLYVYAGHETGRA